MPPTALIYSAVGGVMADLYRIGFSRCVYRQFFSRLHYLTHHQLHSLAENGSWAEIHLDRAAIELY
ncbi:hypothetical protein BG74_02660 [Sodalis-like endosymbiont of Proechinophthirus fluctus]|nr:hypothetical protein BG74_02660 [Sodalis-like endosymbiont of Proechinophthirus fluctus]